MLNFAVKKVGENYNLGKGKFIEPGEIISLTRVHVYLVPTKGQTLNEMGTGVQQSYNDNPAPTLVML